MMVIEEDWKRAYVKGEGISSTKTGDLETMALQSQAMLKKKRLVTELLTPIINVICQDLPQGVDVLGDISGGEHFRNDEFKEVKEERDHLCEEVNASQLEKKKPEKTLPAQEVAMKAMCYPPLYLERIVNRLETEKSCFVQTKERHVYCLSQTTTGEG